MTNADRIRNMSDEELASMLYHIQTLTHLSTKMNREFDATFPDTLDWLQSESKESEEENKK